MEVPFGAQPPAACQRLLTLREETHKHAQTLQAAGQKKVRPNELCKLFEAYLAAESKMVKALEESYVTCGLPRDVPDQVKASHAKAEQMGRNICEMAAQGPQPLRFDGLTPTGGPRRFDAPAPECTEKTLMPGVSLRRLTPVFWSCYRRIYRDVTLRPPDRWGATQATEGESRGLTP